MKIKINRHIREILIYAGYTGNSTLESLNNFLKRYNLEISTDIAFDYKDFKEYYFSCINDYSENKNLKCNIEFDNEDDAINNAVEKVIEIIEFNNDIDDTDLQNENWSLNKIA